MADTELEPPFQAYAGTEPFIFVSYSHQDADSVFAELNELHELGYRIWFDEGIDPGNEWPEEIANALKRSSLFLVFITPNAAASRNVRNEIQLALHLEKPFLAVHICDTQLPAGLQLSMGALQAVLKFRMSHKNYRRKMEKALPNIFRPTPTMCPPHETEPNEVNQGNSSKGTKNRNVALLMQQNVQAAEVGKVYQGKVVTIKEYGVFVEYLPGKDGFVHISELANFRVRQVEDIVKVGETILVKCMSVDEKGRVGLSRKAAM
jgi:hypothetical protein